MSNRYPAIFIYKEFLYFPLFPQKIIFPQFKSSFTLNVHVRTADFLSFPFYVIPKEN